MPTTDQNGDSRPGQCLAGPRVELLLRGRAVTGVGRLGDLVGQPAPAADLVQADQGQRKQRGDDHEELEDLVVDRRAQAAEGDVRQHDDGRDHQGDRERPPEQGVQDAAQQVEVDARDEQLGHGERDRVDEVGAGTEPPEHVLRHRPHLGAVVERHHHDTEEQHRRDGADPEVVHGRDAEVGAVGRHAHDLDGAQVGGDERQARDPRRQRAPRQEEVQRLRHLALGQEADAQHEAEVDDEDQVVDEARVDDRRHRHRCSHGLSSRGGGYRFAT